MYVCRCGVDVDDDNDADSKRFLLLNLAAVELFFRSTNCALIITLLFKYVTARRFVYRSHTHIESLFAILSISFMGATLFILICSIFLFCSVLFCSVVSHILWLVDNIANHNKLLQIVPNYKLVAIITFLIMHQAIQHSKVQHSRMVFNADRAESEFFSSIAWSVIVNKKRNKYLQSLT